MSLAFDWIVSHRWAMLPEALKALAVLSLSGQDKDVSVQDNDDHQKALCIPQNPRMSIALSDGIPVENTRSAELYGSVAVVPLMGPIFSRNSRYAWSNETNIQMFAKDIGTLQKNPQVKSIVLYTHTPGGDITGISEMAEIIYNCRKTKPIDAYIYGLGASAGYWLTAPCRKIVAADTAEIGSIGVVSVFTDYTEWDKKMGVKEIEVVSSQSPLKRLSPATEDGKALLQNKLDGLCDIFIAAVAKYRGVTPEKVASDFGRGDLLIASKAVEAGMIDSTGSLEKMIADLNKQSSPKTIMGGFMNLQELQAQHPETYNAAVALGRTAGVQEGKGQAATEITSATTAAIEKERSRITGILSLSKIPGSAKLIEAALSNPEATKESVAIQVLEAQQESTSKIATAIAADSTDLAAQLQQVQGSAPAAQSEATAEIELGKSIAKLA